MHSFVTRSRLYRIAALLALAACAAAPTEAAAQSPLHRITQSKSYLMVDPIYTTIVDDDKPVGLLMVGIGIDVPDSALRDTARRLMPLLRDGYVRSLIGYCATSVRPWRQPDVTAIADRLQAVTDRALGRKGARVLLAQVAMRLQP